MLEGKTKGYKNHPQLERFKKSENPTEYINAYLYEIFSEAQRRGYNFDKRKIKPVKVIKKLTVTRKQIQYEFEHLLKKLKLRDKEKYNEIKNIKKIKAHPIFRIVNGDIEPWERLNRVSSSQKT